MPESKSAQVKKKRLKRSAHSPDERAALVRTYRQLLPLLIIFAAASIGFSLWAFQQTGVGQTRINAAVLAAVMAAMPVIYFMARQGKPKAAGLMTLAAAMAAYGSYELTLKGLLLYNLVGGSMLILLVGNIVLPRKWTIWGGSVLVYAAALLMLNQAPLLPRYDASSSSIFTNFAAGAIILLVLVFILRLIWFAQRFSIRRRLITAFILIVLIPTAATSAVTLLLFSGSTEGQVIEKLESVATLKQAEIRSWKQGLEPNLFLIKSEQGSQDQIPLLHILSGETPSTPQEYREVYESFMDRFERAIAQIGVFDNLFILDANGTMIISTDNSEEGTDHFGRDYYNQGLNETYITPAFRSTETGQLQIIVVTPYKDETGKTAAILGGQVSMRRINSMMVERAGLGNTGETYLVSPRKVLLTESRDASYRPFSSTVSSLGIDSAVVQRIPGVATYVNYRGKEVIGVYRWLPDLQLGIVTEQERAEALQALYRITYANLITAAAAVLTAIIAGILVTRSLTQPLSKLGKTAERIAAGNLGLAVEIGQRDEIGDLANSFNIMTAQLRSLIASLEERVAERTLAMERRSTQLRVAAEIARDASGLHRLDDLLNGAVNLIRDRFGFYHAGIFLLDEKGEYALLTAATGEAGRELLEKSHKLKVGETGLVGYVTSSGLPRVALDVGADAVHFKNPLLPHTRSEAALPLKIGPNIIGALDVQSTEPNAFNNEAIEVLQIMTDQLAVAIENARLIKEMERTVNELETAYGQYTADSWQEFLQKIQRTRGYRYRGLGAEPLTDLSVQPIKQNGQEPAAAGVDASEADKPSQVVALPLQLRGQTIGAVNIKVKGKDMPEESKAMFQEVINRLCMSLENVRLLEEAQLKSEQLHLLQEITSAAAAYVNLRELLTVVAGKIREGFNLNTCGVILFTEEKGAAEAIQSEAAGPSENVLSVLQLPASEKEALRHLLQMRKAAAFYGNQKNDLPAAIQAFLGEHGTQSFVLTPVLSRGEVIGLLTLEAREAGRRFVDEDLLLIDQISMQVSTAVDVARLFEQTEARAEREKLISEITSRIRESLEMDIVLKTASIELHKALGLEEVEVREVLRSSQPEASAGLGFICRVDGSLSPALEMLTSEMRLAVQTQQKVFGAAGLLFIPVKIRGQAAGVLRLAKPSSAGSWKENEILLVDTLVDQLGMALESSRLYNDTQRRARRERQISEVSARLRSSISIDAIMQTAVQELAETLQVPHGAITLRNEGGGLRNEK